MKNHVNIPIFIPHLGCPNQCVFCNQRTISGVSSFDISTVDAEIREALATISDDTDVEIAFFGGSFTGIGNELMTNLLKLAHPYVKAGSVKSIRCSTRPDYITDEILAILKNYGVRTIELGLQSCIDSVLTAAKRGHAFSDEVKACRKIVDAGFELVGQMMIGLPGSTLDDEIKTAEFIVSSGATGARIYPTVVFSGTELCDMVKSGVYIPLTLDDAIYRAAKVLEVFVKANINVIRIGLCAQDNLYDEKNYFGGAYHPALGELVVGEMLYNSFCDYISGCETISNSLTIYVPVGMLSQAIGQRRKNKERLIERFELSSLRFKEKEGLSQYEFEVEFERK